MKTNRILRELRREIAGLKRAAEGQQTFEEWKKDRKFNNSQTGNQVNFESLPADQQKEERAKFDKKKKKKEEGDSPSSSSAFEKEIREKLMGPLDGALERALSRYRSDHDAKHSYEYGDYLVGTVKRNLTKYFEDQGWVETMNEAEVLSTIGKEPKKMMAIAKVIRESSEKMAEGINKMIEKENADRKVSREEFRKCRDAYEKLGEIDKWKLNKEDLEKYWKKDIELSQRKSYYSRLIGKQAREPVTAEDIYTAALLKETSEHGQEYGPIRVLFALSEKTLKDCEEKVKRDKEREEKNRKMREEAQRQRAEEAQKKEKEKAERDKEREEKNRKMREEAQRQRAEKKEKEKAERERAKVIEKQVKAEYEKKKKESEEKIKKEQKSITDLFDEMEGGKLTPDEAMHKLSYLEGLHSASPYASALADAFKETKAKIEKKREEENGSVFSKLKKLFGGGKKKNKKATLKTARLTAEALRDEVRGLKRGLR